MFLPLTDGCHGQAVEAVREGLPELDVVPALALVVEAVDPSKLVLKAWWG